MIKMKNEKNEKNQKMKEKMQKNDEKRKKMKKNGFTRKILDDFLILFRNVSLSRGKSTTRFGWSSFFRRKVTIFIGRETKTHILPTKMNEKKIAKVSPSNNNYSFRIL